MLQQNAFAAKQLADMIAQSATLGAWIWQCPDQAVGIDCRRKRQG